MMNPSFRENIFLLKNKIFRKNAVNQFKTAVENLNYSKEELENLNWKKRKEIVEFAYNNTTFYKNFYTKHNFDPSSLNKEKDWEKIPCLTKEDVRLHGQDILVKDLPKGRLRRSTTGGSTGVPLQVFHDLNFSSEIIGWRIFHILDIKFGYNSALIWRIPSGRKGFVNEIFNKILWWPTKRIFLDASNLTQINIDKFIFKYNKLKPEVVMGYVGAIDELCHYIENNDIKVVAPKLVWITSSPSTISQKQFYSKVFNAPILDQYGSCEVFWIAANCKESSNLHIFNDFRHIDILDNDDIPVQTNEVGQIAITDLENFAFPLIKYKLGDQTRYIQRECCCGSHFPLIESVKGRMTDNLILPDHSVISGEYLTTLFDDFFDSIQSFKVHQFDDYNIIIFYVPNQGTKKPRINEILIKVEKEIRTKIPQSIDLKFEEKQSIAHDKGKIRFVTSDIKR